MYKICARGSPSQPRLPGPEGHPDSRSAVYYISSLLYKIIFKNFKNCVNIGLTYLSYFYLTSAAKINHMIGLSEIIFQN